MQARDSVSYNASRRMDFGAAMGNAARIGWGSVAGVQVGQRFVVSRQPGSNEVAIGHIHMNSDTNKVGDFLDISKFDPQKASSLLREEKTSFFLLRKYTFYTNMQIESCEFWDFSLQ